MPMNPWLRVTFAIEGSINVSPGRGELYNAPMARSRRSDPMPVKYWSAAGLVLTYWCNARCASCYLCCGPDRSDEMSVSDALEFWRQLVAASPHGCRVHITGGEPFGNWPRLIELLRRGRDEGLGPPPKVETNAFWATDEQTARDRLVELDAAGMGKISISADPYHQQYVPIARCRLLARLAEEILGRDRVQVRWVDWLAKGVDTGKLSPQRRDAMFAEYAAAGRDRLNGRAAGAVGGHLERKPVGQFADTSCWQTLLRCKHVHVDGLGRLMPGTCAGIVLGTVGPRSVAEIWRQLDADHARRPIVGTLAAKGPVGLLEEAISVGFRPAVGYAGKCQLCWDLRTHLAASGLGLGELSPAWMYLAGRQRDTGL